MNTCPTLYAILPSRYLLIEAPRRYRNLDNASEGVRVVELPAGDGAPLLETDHPEPDEGGRLTPVGTLEHHGDLKSGQMSKPCKL